MGISNNLDFFHNHQGKGYPDMNTRLILNKLRELHTLPIHIVTDADPYGIEIMLTYRHGSLVSKNKSKQKKCPSFPMFLYFSLCEKSQMFEIFFFPVNVKPG